MNHSGVRTNGKSIATLLAAWLLVILAVAYIGVFGGDSRYSMDVPIPLGVAALLPIALYILWFRLSTAFRGFVLALNPAVVTAIHTWRIGGIVFLILLAKKMLPPSFAYPAGLGDMAIGITAPLVAIAISRKKISPRLQFVWQLAGAADLIIAIAAGVLSSDSKLGILAHGTSTRLMGLLPLCLIPTFIVPLLLILHLISMARIRQDRLQKNGPAQPHRTPLSV